MSKKKKRKFKYNKHPHRDGSPAVVSRESVSSVAPVVSAVSSSAVAKPASSAVQSYFNTREASANSTAYAAHRTEYKNINKDLIKVIVINGVLFGIILGMYFLNRSNPFLDSWYDRIF